MSKLGSSLISVSPIGVGTPMCESLFSFLLRLANVNQIRYSELISYIAQECGIKSNTRGVVDVTFTRNINLGNDITLKFIEFLEQCVAHTELHLLTVSRWRFIFADGLLHKDRWFYPNSEHTHELLANAISPVFWTSAGMPLEKHCHACGETSLNAQQGYQIGICAKCGTSLDSYHRISASKNDKYTTAHRNYNDIEYSIWVAKAVGEIVAYTGDTSAFDFSKALDSHLRYFNINKAKDASKMLSVSHISINSWINEGVRPRFDQFLNICYCMRVSPIEFFRQDMLTVGSVRELRASPKKTRTAIASSKRTRVDKDKMEDRLLTDMRSKKFLHLSFREYCEKELGRKDPVVRQYFPELSKRFVAQNKEFGAQRARTVRAGRMAEILEASRICLELDQDINHKNLRHYLTQPGMLMSQWARNLIKAIKRHGPDNLPTDIFCEC